MNNLKSKSIKQLKDRRDLLVNALAFSIDEEDRAAFQKAIDGLESQMYRKVKIALIVVSILVLLSIVSSGCGKMLEGTGRIMEGLGDGMVYAGEHIQESTSTK